MLVVVLTGIALLTPSPVLTDPALALGSVSNRAFAPTSGIVWKAPGAAPEGARRVAAVEAVAGPDDSMPAGEVGGAVGTSGKASFEEAAEGVRALYLEGSFDAAIAAADAFADRFRQRAAYETDGANWDAWANAQVTKAMALARLDRAKEADDTMRAVAVVRPSWMPDRAFVPPRQAARYDEIREALLAGRTIPVVLAMEGVGEPCLDGRLVSPGVTVDVLPGTHHLGVAGKGRTVEITEAGTIPAMVSSSSSSDGTAVGVGTGPDPGATVVEDDGPPWVLIGVGTAVVVLVAGATVGVFYAVQGQGAEVPNPGGTTISVDASRFKQRGSAP